MRRLIRIGLGPPKNKQNKSKEVFFFKTYRDIRAVKLVPPIITHLARAQPVPLVKSVIGAGHGISLRPPRIVGRRDPVDRRPAGFFLPRAEPTDRRLIKRPRRRGRCCRHIASPSLVVASAGSASGQRTGLGGDARGPRRMSG